MVRKRARFPRAACGAGEGCNGGGRSPPPCQVEPRKMPKAIFPWRGAWHTRTTCCRRYAHQPCGEWSQEFDSRQINLHCLCGIFRSRIEEKSETDSAALCFGDLAGAAGRERLWLQGLRALHTRLFSPRGEVAGRPGARQRERTNPSGRREKTARVKGKFVRLSNGRAPRGCCDPRARRLYSGSPSGFVLCRCRPVGVASPSGRNKTRARLVTGICPAPHTPLFFRRRDARQKKRARHPCEHPAPSCGG